MRCTPGAQVLFRSLDQGKHWDTISPDLTGKTDGAQHCDGDVAVEHASACGYGVIFSIAPSPHSNDEIWIGTDDGLIQLTRDGGKSWNNVTPKGIPAWAKVSALDVSALDAGTAYAAVDNHRQDDFRPRILRTHDYGASWSEIANGLPDGHFVSVVRADPVRRGLLYAGTDTGVFVSFDDGDHWQPLQRNLPVAWVRDLLVHGNDLIAATQGPRDLGARRRHAAAPARCENREGRSDPVRARAGRAACATTRTRTRRRPPKPRSARIHQPAH